MVPSLGINLAPDLALTVEPDGSVSSRVFHEDQRTKDEFGTTSEHRPPMQHRSLVLRPSSIVIPRGHDDDRRKMGAGGRREKRRTDRVRHRRRRIKSPAGPRNPETGRRTVVSAAPT